MSDKTRDHLANERTFLAWIRTALGLLGFGFVLARMGLFLIEFPSGRADGPSGQGSWLGHEFVLSGIVFLLLGTLLAGCSGWMYHQNRRAIENDAHQPTRVAITALSMVVVVAGALIVALATWRFTAGRP